MVFFVFGIVYFASFGEPEPLPPELIGGLFVFMFIVQTVITSPSFIAAYALLKKKHWAKTASIVAAVVAGMSIPVGTAACVYSLWFFMGDNWKSIYPEKADRLQGDPLQISYGVESQQAAYEEEEKKRREDHL